MDEDPLYTEVEDIMCDQGIITAELNMDIQTGTSTNISVTRFRLAVAVITRTILPSVADIYYTYLRNQKTLVENICHQLVPALVAFVMNSVSVSLNSVHRSISYPLTIRRHLPPAIKQTTEEEEKEYEDTTPEKSVECLVVAEPEPTQPIVADIIFIHGLQGSLGNTWRQGMWLSNRQNIRQAIIERSKSLGDIEVAYNHKPTSLKRSVSCRTCSIPKKMRRIHEDANEEFVKDDHCDQYGNDVYSKCWPKDWLPQDCPGVRVIALNYTTDPYLWRPVWIKKRNRSCMVERSQEMIEHLLKLGVGNHPIVWVGHSKGGLFVKQLLVKTKEAADASEARRLFTQTKGIMFYSVPHRGSSLADFDLPLLRRSIELMEIAKDSDFVLNLHSRFLELFEDSLFSPEIFSFIETSLTLMTFVYLKIVPLDSADPGVGSTWGVPLDHREICKPANRNCFLYKELVKLIHKAIFNRDEAN